MSTTDTTTPAIEDHWRIGGIVLDGHAGAEPTLSPSEAYDFRAIMTSRSDPPESDPNAWRTHTERLAALLGYGHAAGEYHLHDPEGTGVAYTETHNGNVPGGSLVVTVRPPGDSALGRGGWYLVDSVEDATTLEKWCEVSVSLVYLAPLSAYASVAELQSALEAPTLI